MRYSILAVIVVALSASTLVHAEEWRKQYIVSGKPTVHIEGNDINVTITSWDQKEVDAHVIADGYKIGPNNIRVHESQSGDEIRIEVRKPGGTYFNFGYKRSLQIEVNVPRESNLSLHTADGNIRVDGVSGELRLVTDDGNVDANGLAGKLDINTSDGNVKLSGRFDALNLRTGDGNVEVQASEGSTNASGWRLESSDGNVRLRLPSNFTADLDARTGDGKITLDVPVLTTGNIGQNNIHGKINGGGAPLELRTGDGNISLNRL